MLIGVVGKPNCGKSTFFKALTLAEVEIANYPFTTIKPNSGIGYVEVDCADKDFNLQCKPKHGYCLNHTRFVPVQVMDVAGLVPGAHEGKGMGNQFLDDLRQADVLIHIVDVAGTTNEKGESVKPGEYDPVNDVKFLEVELDMWYLGLLKKGWGTFARKMMQEKADINKSLSKHLEGLAINEKMVEGVIKNLSLPTDFTQWDDKALLNISVALRKLTKPMIIACNKIDVPGAAENFERLKKEFPGNMLIACSAESELALKEATKHGFIKYVPGTGSFDLADESKLNERQKQGLNFIKSNILDKYNTTGVQHVLQKAVYDLLKYIAVFPVANSKLQDKDGNTLPDCFLVPQNSTALEFAFKVHTDLGNNFIRAIDLKKKNVVGKDHIVNHRDVIEIVSSR